MLTSKNSEIELNRNQSFTDTWKRTSPLTFWIGVFGVLLGIATGWLAGAQPLYLVLLLIAAVVFVCFFAEFELAVMGLLILRSSLDIFSAQQLPAAYAVGVSGLTLVYVTCLLLTQQTVNVDWLWLFLAGWVLWQALWLILCVFGGLGLGTEVLGDNVREWTRLFSWLMVYLLIMQLKGRVKPQKIISILFIALITPICAGFLQLIFPDSVLPSFLATYHGDRLNGTLGHPNAFATFILFFIGLTYWRLRCSSRFTQSQKSNRGAVSWATYRGQKHRDQKYISWSSNRLFWLLLLGVLTLMLIGTRTMVVLAMLGIFVLVTIAPKFNWLNLIGGVLLLVLVLGLFISTPFGQERLQSLAQTPLFNSNIDISRAILLSDSDYNSFNWRLAQWHYLLTAWQQFPIFGYGLATSKYLSIYNLEAHNDYVRALAESGLVGLATFLTFLAAQGIRLVQLLRQTTKNKEQNDFCLILLALFAAMLVGMLTENIWTHTTLWSYWWTVLAVAGWEWGVEAESNQLLTINKS
ncbi:MAG: O-antigen ligase family protein [Pleurocapsa minor HA4230-MV1]|jgi:O-antigen ligase|nr:O-antigen ligase family protein [Pleurocapsa minor HA4230-MV1]